MRKISVTLLAIALSGCASMHAPRLQSHVVAPKVTAPPAIATPLVKPKWYDKFRQKNGKFLH